MDRHRDKSKTTQRTHEAPTNRPRTYNVYKDYTNDPNFRSHTDHAERMKEQFKREANMERAGFR